MLLPGRSPMKIPSLQFSRQQKQTLLSITSSIVTSSVATSSLSLTRTNDRSYPSEGESDMMHLPPRAQSVVLMACAMALHFGGYEFIRNSCLSLFTSESYGFQSSAAFPLANGLISPFSVFLLWGYERQLEAYGPRGALRNTTLYSALFVAVVSILIATGRHLALPKIAIQSLVGITFLFQNSYQYLLFTQQQSFVGSVLTPNEGAQWFGTITGFSSLVSMGAGTLVPIVGSSIGLPGLMGLTCVTLIASMLCSDRAYALSQKHGFDPSVQGKDQKSKHDNDDRNKFTKAANLFKRVPTLRALIIEVFAFQSLNTILNVAFVRGLKQNVPNDLDRSAYTSKFFSLVNAVSATLQFLILPFCMKRTEPIIIWRAMPLIPLAICVWQVARAEVSLTLLSAAFFIGKVLDYSIRSVVYAMVYQPLDFESRYVGKEIIGVFGSRFGKSGMSVVLSGLTALGLTGLVQLGQLSVGASFIWLSSTWWLSQHLPRKAQAQAIVEERRQQIKED